MTCYIKNDILYWPTPDGAIDIHQKLPAGTYTVGLHPEKGFFLKVITDFKNVGKVYGDTPKHADRIVNSFNVRPNSTGVWLTGEKGSGKTMLAKIVSQTLVADGVPTIIINSPFCGDAFNSFIQSLDDAVVIFDEFEKVFDSDEQEAILTLLDGVYPTKKLFIITTNDVYRVNQHLNNRPGRIFYRIEYKGVDLAFVREYCQDNLNNKSYIEKICSIISLYHCFNFDMLKALVEEMNRYNEDPIAALEILNARPFSDGDDTKYEVNITLNGVEIDMNHIYPSVIEGSPVSNNELDFRGSYEDGDSDDDKHLNVEINQSHLKGINADAGVFTYELIDKKQKYVITFKRRQNKMQYRWQEAF